VFACIVEHAILHGPFEETELCHCGVLLVAVAVDDGDAVTPTKWVAEALAVCTQHSLVFGEDIESARSPLAHHLIHYVA
jgi:hypothetical protein